MNPVLLVQLAALIWAHRAHYDPNYTHREACVDAFKLWIEAGLYLEQAKKTIEGTGEGDVPNGE